MTKKKTFEQEPAKEEHPVTPEAVAAPTQSLVVTDEMLSPKEVAQVLERRAHSLAQSLETESPGDSLQVVIFALGEEYYALEARFVENIYPLEGFTPVPCTPAFVRGVVNLRGRILSLVDLHRFLGLTGVQIDADSQVIVVNAAGIELGLLSNEVRSVGPLPLKALRPSLPTTARVAAEFTRGVTTDMLVLLDLEALLRDPRMTVQEEVG